MDILVPIVVTIVLILLNGLFVAAEFAIISAPKTAVERRAQEGDALAKVVAGILRDPQKTDRYIATAQLGITFASLGLGMYGEHNLARWFAGWFESLGVGQWVAAHTLASITAIGLLTYLHIVVGEMVPKSLALMYAEKTAIAVTRPMLWFKRAMYPLVVGLNGIGNGILKLMGINRSDASHSLIYTPEDLEVLVQESQEGGTLREETGEVLQELFDFGELTAGEAMVPRVKVVGIRVGATTQEIASIIRESRHTRYPIYQENMDQIIGTIHIKDLMRILLDNQVVQEQDVRTVPFVPETTALERTFAIMREERAQMVVVMDEYGGTAGLLTMDDLVAEVVGEIEEKGETASPVRTESDGKLRALGTVRLDEIGDALDRDLEHEEVDSISGLVLMLLERPPVVGDRVTFAELTFEVTAVEGHGVKECLITPSVREAEQGKLLAAKR